MAVVDSINVGMPAPNPHKRKPVVSTGIDKRPQPGSIQVRDPGPRPGGLGSGVVGDHIGDVEHHGGSEQAVYAFARENLDRWEHRLARPLTNGFFGENLTTRGLDVDGARLGEIWQVGGTVQLQVTVPRIPCVTFRGWVDEQGWLKTFTLDARPGAYLRVLVPGPIAAGDVIELLHRPDHEVTVSLAYRAMLTEPELLPSLMAAGDDLVPGLAERARSAT